MTNEEYEKHRIVFIGIIKQTIPYAYNNKFDLEDIISYCFEDYVKAKLKRIEDKQIYSKTKLKLYTYIRDNFYREKTKINRDSAKDFEYEKLFKKDKNVQRVLDRIIMQDIFNLCTKRQKTILKYKYLGFTNEEIAGKLKTSRITINADMQKIKKRSIEIQKAHPE